MQGFYDNHQMTLGGLFMNVKPIEHIYNNANSRKKSNLVVEENSTIPHVA